MSRRNRWPADGEKQWGPRHCGTCHQFIAREDETNRYECEACEKMRLSAEFLSELISEEGREKFEKRMAWIDKQIAKEEADEL